MSSPCNGSIIEEECTSHRHVEWNIDFRPLRESSIIKLASPVFSVGSQHYTLNLCRKPKDESRGKFWLCLRLCRMGPSADSPPVRWWAGLQRGDCTYSHRNKFGKLNLEKEFSIWTEVEELLRVNEVELEKNWNLPDNLTAFFHVKLKLLSTRAEACKHCNPRMPPFVGNIIEEECTSHKRVEWNFGRKVRRGVLSPDFEIADQRYMLEFSSENSYSLLFLYRMGPPIDGPSKSVRWWTGLKHNDGTYNYTNAFGDLNLEEEFSIWTEATVLLRIESSELGLYGNNRTPITVFFQMKMEQSSTGTETCTHDSPRDMFPPSQGIIYEEKCNFHKHVEWIVKYDMKLKNRTSAVFEAGKQLYRLMIHGIHGKDALSLFRLGPSVDDPDNCVQWWMGLKRADGTYHHKNVSGTLHLQKECELWSEVVTLMPDIPRKMIKEYLAPGERLAFIFWMNVETRAEACTHGRPDTFPRGFGSIVEEEWTSYKLIRWKLDFYSLRSVTSPVFRVGEQLYLLELECLGCSGHLYLYRMGRSVDRSDRWWVGVNCRDKMCHDQGSETGKLNLRKTCDLWALMRCLHSVLVWDEDINHLLIDFLVSLEQSPSAGEVCISAEGQVHDSSYLPAEDVLFKVQDRAFRMHRAIIRFAAPMMGFMYCNTTSESGIVHITDCEPNVFEEFVKLIESGFTQVPTAENALCLYPVADTYHLDNLKKMCRKRIADTMSVDSFCDVVRLCFRHKEEDLLKNAISFLSRNKEITESDSYSNFVSENPDAANELMAKAFPPEE